MLNFGRNKFAQEDLEGSMKELLQGELHMRAQDISADCMQMNYEVRQIPLRC